MAAPRDTVTVFVALRMNNKIKIILRMSKNILVAGILVNIMMLSVYNQCVFSPYGKEIYLKYNFITAGDFWKKIFNF